MCLFINLMTHVWRKQKNLQLTMKTQIFDYINIVIRKNIAFNDNINYLPKSSARAGGPNKVIRNTYQ